MIELCKILYLEDPVKFQHSIIENEEFSYKISSEYKNLWTALTIDNRTLYINTMIDTKTKIRTLNMILEQLDLEDSLVTLKIKSY